MTPQDRRAVAIWLLACALIVACIVVVGGVTRLTRSGLSIVEWQPVAGALPPVTDVQWAEAFDKYKQTPEFRQVNHDMDLAGFKRIFWWEYGHRLLGRLAGFVFLLPFLWFLYKRKIPKPLGVQLAGVFVLGAMQGALGWYMVASGLVDDPRVSQFRLTAHLGMALLILSLEVWIALDLLLEKTRSTYLFVPILVFLMALSGGMVAGIRAGYAYNTFPLMNGQWVPGEMLMMEPWWMNFGYNMAAVQFVHRAFFWLLLAVIVFISIRNRFDKPSRLLLSAFALQAGLGIATLLHGAPLALAAPHQAGAVLLLLSALWFAHRAGRAA